MTPFMQKWTNYRDTRRGTFLYRSGTRYRAVADRLFKMGLRNARTILDVGAGSCQFGRYMRDRGWPGVYRPVDAVIDGTDLEVFEAFEADWIVCIETLKHLTRPERLLKSMMRAARYGVVVTTPNGEVVNVIDCDPTHQSVVPAWGLELLGFDVTRESWFGKPSDTLLAWRAS